MSEKYYKDVRVWRAEIICKKLIQGKLRSVNH